MPSDILGAHKKSAHKKSPHLAPPSAKLPVISVSCACRPLHMDAYGVDRNTVCSIPCARSSDRVPACGATHEQERYEWRLSAFDI